MGRPRVWRDSDSGMLLQWVDLGDFGAVRLTTILTAIALLFIITWRTRKPWIAVVAILAWASLYEMVYQITGFIMYREAWTTPWTKPVWAGLALIAWPILAHTQGIKLNKWVVPAFAGIWLLWVGFGFHSNSPAQWNPYVARDELLNVVSKTTLAVAYLWASIRSPQASYSKARRRNLSPATNETYETGVNK